MNILQKFKQSWDNSDPNYRAFLLGILFLGINQGILNSTFNNYLNDLFQISSTQRGLIEFPREFPGFALIFVTALLSVLSIRYWAMLVCILSFIGVWGLGFLSPTFYVAISWMLFWSMADHLFMPVESTMGLQLAKENQEGRRLGQISGARNLSMIFGTLAVWGGMSLFSFSYKMLYFIAGLSALVAFFLFARIRIAKEKEIPSKKFVYRKEYHLFYILNILFGARKQLFLTFSPWVLVSVFNVKADTMAILLLISSFLGFFFRQYFGVWVDKIGERSVLAWDAFILLGICLGFAFSKNIYVLYTLLIIDNLMFATRIARTTYMKKVALEKSDIPTSISFGVTLDHVISMTIPFLGGLLWTAFGYPAVFIAASLIALLNFWAAMKIPKFEVLSKNP